LSACVAILSLNLAGSPLIGQGERHEYRQVHMGMEVRIVLAGPAGPARLAAAAAFERIAELDDRLSDWRPDSELRRLESRPTGSWIEVSRELFEVVSLARQMAVASDGAFDPTVGPLTAIWRQQRSSGIPPAAAELSRALAAVGYGKLELDSAGQRLRFAATGMRLDLGGIAKGWILDQAKAAVERHGIREMLIEAGGDMVLGSGNWPVAVSDDRGERIVQLSNVAVATSGPAFQSIVDTDGVRRSHVVDPTSGQGVARSRQVTVQAPSGAVADALATIFTIRDPATDWRMARGFGARIIGVVE
jgi:thiamine biosynthesis lipoprotein